MGSTLLLADDHPIVRAGLRSIVSSRHAVVAEADDGAAAVELALARKPDLALLDLSMPRLSGFEAIRRIRSATHTRCLALSMHEGQTHVLKALEAGAHGYVAKTAAPTELLTAIDAVASGRSYLSPSIACWALDAIARPNQRPGSAFATLTGREREVLQLVAEGLSTKEIASQLGVSTKTIETHRSHVMGKLQVHKASQLVRVAILEGLVTMPSAAR